MNLTVINQFGQRVLTTQQLAESFGTNSDRISKNYSENKDRYIDGKHFVKLEGEKLKDFKNDFRNSELVHKQASVLYLWTEKGTWLHAKSLNTNQAWDAYEMLVDEYYRFKDLTNQLEVSKKEIFEMQLIGVQYTSQILRVDETSKILMLEKAHKQHGVATNHLPVYVDEEVTKSLTALLKENNVNIGAAKVNTKLIELGVLEIKERPSSKGGTKEFKSLTVFGNKYGKNLLNPRSPKETQPHYYTSKFSSLLELMGYTDQKTA